MGRRMVVRKVIATTAALLASLAIASTTLAHECVNFSKSDQGAGAQIVFGPDGEIQEITPGALARIQRGLIDPATGEGFHGLAGFDLDGDGVADVSTWFGIGPDGEIPLTAQLRGPACKGLTNIGVYFAQCAGG
jgi:hypothetical protein